MNPQLFIEAIVSPNRGADCADLDRERACTPPSRVADQMFLDLAREIEAQGVSRKVTADMFSLPLRTYGRPPCTREVLVSQGVDTACVGLEHLPLDGFGKAETLQLLTAYLL